MDDKTRGLGDERDDDMIGRGDDMTRNLETGTPGSARVRAPRPAPPSRARAASRPPASSTDLDPEADRKTRLIESEIAETRDEMAETIDAIQEKLRPANLVAEAKEKVRTATTEKVRHMRETATETAEGAMRQTRNAASDLVEGARQNPIPALMIGAGVAWLLMSRSRQQKDPYLRATSADWQASEDLDEWNEPVAGRGSYRSAVRDAGARTRGAVEEARHTFRRTAQGAQNGFQRLLRDNPLLVGAAAIVAGAAVGAALPETERENEWLGDARDSMVDRAQDAARTAATTVQEVAGNAVQQVTDRISSEKGPERQD